MPQVENPFKSYTPDELREKYPDKDVGQHLKKDAGKPQVDLVPPEVIFALAHVLGFGAKKYARRAWESGDLEPHRIYAALQRHLLDFMMGKRIDEESGLPTLWHALAELTFLVTYEQRGLLKEVK